MQRPASPTPSVDLLMLENRGAVVQLGGHINVALIYYALQRCLPTHFLIEILIKQGWSGQCAI